MSIESVFKNEFEKKIRSLEEENKEVHQAVIRKHNELMKMRMNMITEVCPECGTENTIEWSVIKEGYQAFCPKCGWPMMLCSECMLDRDFCDWNGDTAICYRMVEGFWKNLTDVPFMEDEKGRLVLENDYSFMIGTREVAMFPAGTDREEIWYWFDKHHPNGVAYLLNGDE